MVGEIVLPALEAESSLHEKLNNELMAMFSEYAISIVLFGSYARGDIDNVCDVDVLVVTASAE